MNPFPAIFSGLTLALLSMTLAWAMVGGELSDDMRQKIKGLLGVDIDLRFIKTQCRVSQGNLDREVMSQLGYLKSELMRCDGSI